MAYIRRKKKTDSTVSTIKKAAKGYEIDGLVYRTKALVDYHLALKSSKHVKSFKLPTMGNEKEAKGKFGSFKITVNDMQFDSIMESRYYIHLLMLKADKKIRNFERQVTIELQPKFKDQFTGKTILPIRYIADFVVEGIDGTKTVIDVKGVETPEFRIKKKMFQFKYPNICFKCVRWVPKEQKWVDLDDLKAIARKAKGIKDNA